MNNRKTNQLGLDLIKEFEGFREKAYQDSVGVWTIGFGHTKGVKKGQVISKSQGESFLKEDLNEAEKGVGRLVEVALTENQFSSLVSFVFNLGSGTLERSTLLRLLNQGDYSRAADQILRFNRAGGKVLPGLQRRREAERKLFLQS